METVQEVITPEEQKARKVAVYKAFLKRRAEEHTKDDADPKRQTRIAEAQAELKIRNKEAGTPLVAIPSPTSSDESAVRVRYRFIRSV